MTTGTEKDAETDRPQSAQDYIALLDDYEKRGEYFREYDLACSGIERFPDHLPLKYKAVFSLARAGATDRAEAAFDDYGLRASPDLDSATLWGRILKDKAIEAKSEVRPLLLNEAAEAYEAAAQKARHADTTMWHYPAVNAAQLYLLAGDHQHAAAYAQQIVEHLAHDDAQVGRLDKWELASLVTSLFLLKELERAKDLTPKLAAAFHGDWGAAAINYQHIERLSRHLKVEADWIDDLRPPAVIHYCGHIVDLPGRRHERFPSHMVPQLAEKIEHVLGNRDFSRAFGSLAAGADMLFAEALLDRGAQLTVVLPCDEKEFLEASVKPLGREWHDRYTAILKRDNVRQLFTTTEPLLDDDSLFTFGSRTAMGLAVLHSNHLSARVEQLALWDQGPPSGNAGTAVDVKIWGETGRRTTVIPLSNNERPQSKHVPPPPLKKMRRHARAMLFGDFVNFSKLDGKQIKCFVEVVLKTIAEVLDRHHEAVLRRNTWGDGIFVVTKRACEAAHLALEIMEAVKGLRDNELLAAVRLPPELSLRLGADLGPVFEVHDAIIGETNFLGGHVNRAARIEPVTPPGSVYVTEPFAASLALNCGQHFKCEHVGKTELAKKYGSTRIFLLRRKVPPELRL